MGTFSNFLFINSSKRFGLGRFVRIRKSQMDKDEKKTRMAHGMFESFLPAECVPRFQ